MIRGSPCPGSRRSRSRSGTRAGFGFLLELLQGQRQQRPRAERQVDLAVGADEQFLAGRGLTAISRRGGRVLPAGQPAVEPAVDRLAQRQRQAVLLGRLRLAMRSPAPATS